MGRPQHCRYVYGYPNAHFREELGYDLLFKPRSSFAFPPVTITVPEEALRRAIHSGSYSRHLSPRAKLRARSRGPGSVIGAMTAALGAAVAAATMVSGSNGLAAARLLSRTFLCESCPGSLLQASAGLGLHVLAQAAAELFQAGPREGATGPDPSGSSLRVEGTLSDGAVDRSRPDSGLGILQTRERIPAPTVTSGGVEVASRLALT